MKIIGLTGPARSGKDTAAETLVNKGWRQYRFADPLKKSVQAMFGLTERHTDGDLKESPIDWLDGVTPRQIMQTLGTEWGRDCIHPDLWLRVADRALERTADHGHPGIVISDVRFDNEAAFVRDRGGSVVHIRRESAGSVNAHSSESGVTFDAADYLIDNNGTIHELGAQIRRIAGAA